MTNQLPDEWRKDMNALQSGLEAQFGEIPTATILLYAASIFTASFVKTTRGEESLIGLIENFFGQVMPQLMPERKLEVIEAVEKVLVFFIKSKFPEQDVTVIRLKDKEGEDNGFHFHCGEGDHIIH